MLYLANATDDKSIYFASIQFYFAIANIYATAIRALDGIVTLKTVGLALIGAVVCIVGDIIGLSLFKKLNAERIKQIIYIGMIISGIIMLI